MTDQSDRNNPYPTTKEEPLSPPL